MEYFVRSKSTGSIINCINTRKRKDEIDLVAMFGARGINYYLDEDPPLGVLQQYQYFNERP